MESCTVSTTSLDAADPLNYVRQLRCHVAQPDRRTGHCQLLPSSVSDVAAVHPLPLYSAGL
jgi:hypothetical protein